MGEIMTILPLVKTHIIPIDNSQGIRLPKLLLDQANLGEEVELEIQNGQIIIRATHLPRQGWEAQFQLMATEQDDVLIEAELLPTIWDEEEWEWS